MIVEMLGPPGAGKSALLPATTRALASWSGHVCESADQVVDRYLRRSMAGRLLAPLFGRRPRRFRVLLVDLPYGLRFMLWHPRPSRAVIIAIARAPVGWGHRWTLLMRWVGVAARHEFLRRRLGADIVVFDEGLYHRSVNLFAWRGTGQRHQRAGRALSRELRAYLDAMPAPDVALFVDAPDAVAERRLAERGLPLRLRERPTVQVAAFLASARTIARAVPGWTADRTKWITVDNATTLDAAARQLVDGLARLSDAGSAASGLPVVVWRGPTLRRLDRWWQSRPRALSANQRRELRAIASEFGIAELRGARSIGAGRSWNIVVDTDHGRLVLKRYKDSVEVDAISSEHGVLRRLAELGIPAPRLVAGPDGATVVHREGASFAAFHHVSGYVPMHELIVSSAHGRAQVHAAGRAMQALHDALADQQPAVFPRTGLGPDGGRREPSAAHAEWLRHGAAALSIAERSMAALGERLCELDGRLAAASLRTTLIHGDYGPYNLLVRPGRPLLVIDFELARLDWRLLDLVTAIPRFAVSRVGLSVDRFTSFMAGYLEADALMRSELVHAPMLLEFLSLRRAAVCLRRHDGTPAATLLREASDCIRAARSLADGTHRLIGPFEAASR